MARSQTNCKREERGVEYTKRGNRMVIEVDEISMTAFW